MDIKLHLLWCLCEYIQMCAVFCWCFVKTGLPYFYAINGCLVCPLGLRGPACFECAPGAVCCVAWFAAALLYFGMCCHVTCRCSPSCFCFPFIAGLHGAHIVPYHTCLVYLGCTACLCALYCPLTVPCSPVLPHRTVCTACRYRNSVAKTKSAKHKRVGAKAWSKEQKKADKAAAG